MTKPKNIRWKRPVLCLDNGRVWESARACSRATGIPYMTLLHCISRGGVTHGMSFVQADDETLEQYRRSKQIKVGDEVYLRNDPNNPGVVESIDGDVVRFRFDKPIEYCECMREQLVKVEKDEPHRFA